MKLLVGVFGGLSYGALAFAAGCGSTTPPGVTPRDDASTPIVIDAGDKDAGATITSITTSPDTLQPTFSPTIYDYYVRCSFSENVETVNVKFSDGSSSAENVGLELNQLLEIGDYNIRCLPPDFPTITVKTSGVGPTPGYYLVNSSSYAIVLDTNGTPIWYDNLPSPFDLDSQLPNTLSLFPNAQFPYGLTTAVEAEVLSIDPLSASTFKAVGAPTDEHEIRFLANGDYLIFADPIEQHVDLTGLNTYGADENIADCQIQEINAEGNEVWSWLASDHVDPVQESLEQIQNEVNGVEVDDVFHCNAIDVDSTGNLLLSFRHTNSVFYVDRSSGTIQWKLGGTSYNKDGAIYVAVVDDPETAFNMQHDARLLANGDVTVFDDHGADGGKSGQVARGVEYALDRVANTASVVWQFLGSAESQYQGSFRRYADGHSVVGWGYVPGDPRIFSEVDSNGNDVLDVSFTAPSPVSAIAYRAIKVPPSQLDVDLLRAAVQ